MHPATISQQLKLGPVDDQHLVCSPGQPAQQLRRQGESVSGLSVEPERIASGRAWHLAEEPVRLEVRLARGEHSLPPHPGG